ncbi:MAG: asparagine synthase (glutamine-hydrolyzing) [Gemmatimonadetes bacterium]|nr:asparagine synthase (glutamine-hydrolyzing) [Gemmatimonadota bacterium]
MCGIAGKYSLDGTPVDRSLLSRMARTMIHRGPDDGGLYAHGAFGMAMRRLSIIDLTKGHQPISNEDGSIWVTLNGEIYNFVELRDELRGRGHLFTTATDTEVIVHLYEERGERCVDALRGMFAFAIWDARQATLVLARDRLGKKPLYYAVIPGRGLVFASELKAVLEDDAVDRSIDLEALDRYAQLLYIPGPASIFQHVRKLPAGHLLICTPQHMTVRSYWDVPIPETAPHEDRSEQDVVEHFRQLLRDAVRMRLRSDVPLGAFLSGGVDSSAVTSAMAGLLERPVVTASIGFDEDGYSELPYARVVARQIQSRHCERTVVAPSPEVIEKIVWHLDEPFADSSAIPTYFVSMTAREHVTVALSGDGGDELFAGYARHRLEVLEHTLRRGAGTVGGRTLARAAALAPDGTKGRNMLLNLARAPEEACARKFFFSPHAPNLKTTLYTPWFRAATAACDPLAPFKHAYRAARSTDPLSRILYVDLKTYLADDILSKVDRMSMAHSLEVRAPLLDHKLVEFVAGLHPRWKLRGRTTKVLLRAALDGTVPPHAVDRKKHGFVSPIGPWLRTALASYVEETICSPRARSRGYFAPDAVRRLWDAHRTGRANFEHEIWMLLVLEVWHRILVDGDRPDHSGGEVSHRSDERAAGGRLPAAVRGRVGADCSAPPAPLDRAGIRLSGT